MTFELTISDPPHIDSKGCIRHTSASARYSNASTTSTQPTQLLLDVWYPVGLQGFHVFYRSLTIRAVCGKIM
eukprot:5402264-Amphidinium_carterae.2